MLALLKRVLSAFQGLLILWQFVMFPAVSRNSSKVAKLLPVGCMSLSLLACTAGQPKAYRHHLSEKSRHDLAAHVLMADSLGQAIDPRTSDVLSRDANNEYLDAMLQEFRKFCLGRHPCKLLIFFHGGLNGESDTYERVKYLTETIEKSGSFPIFVSWDSSFVTSYEDHLFRIRKGIYEKKRYAVMAPIILGMDEGSALAQLPADWAAEARHTFPDLLENRSIGWSAAMASYVSLISSHQQSPDNSVTVNDILEPDTSILRDERARWREKVVPMLTLAPTLPTKLLAPPMAIHAMGSGAWDVMYRRTSTLFMTEGEYNNDIHLAGVPLLKAFIGHYIEKWVGGICQPKPAVLEGCADLAVTLVGHSMGSIIIDQWIRNAPDLELRNIVFMAGATTVADYRDTVLRYLNRQHERFRIIDTEDRRPHVTDVYHLVLHPTAEILESGFIDLAPRGSLLVWIDNYFSNPVTPLDRTVGRFFNLMPELARTPEGVRPQIHAKVFDVGATKAETNPQVHHQFSMFPFWNDEFWKPNPENPPHRCRPDSDCEESR